MTTKQKSVAVGVMAALLTGCATGQSGKRKAESGNPTPQSRPALLAVAPAPAIQITTLACEIYPATNTHAPIALDWFQTADLTQSMQLVRTDLFDHWGTYQASFSITNQSQCFWKVGTR